MNFEPLQKSSSQNALFLIVLVILLYVDDMLVADPNKDRITDLKAQLAREFEIFGPANKILDF